VGLADRGGGGAGGPGPARGRSVLVGDVAHALGSSPRAAAASSPALARPWRSRAPSSRSRRSTAALVLGGLAGALQELGRLAERRGNLDAERAA
jgi:hypothetical protein